MRFGGDMGPNMGTTINKIACATNRRKLNSVSHMYSSNHNKLTYHKGSTLPKGMACLIQTVAPKITSLVIKEVKRRPSKEKNDVIEAWKEIKVIVYASYDIPARVTKRIEIRVTEAPLGSDICLQSIGNVRQLAVESTFSTIRDDHINSSEHYWKSYKDQTMTSRKVPDV
ncbi:hypothetical protein E2C01_034645 [Portunus trituberculatus]|uniref:Uncharacterized protein n=1 Tax=Portunus trituberculatus TaxID=210409 RepID=A0A5B7F997_PORTR|nr:hypothetical protein [Portunus trituberculatus]